MKDLTRGSVARYVLSMAVPTAAGLLLLTLYVVVDLYFVAGLGDAAVAGVSAAGNVMLVGLALAQALVTLLCQWQPEAIVRIFSREPDVVRVGAVFLQLVSWCLILEAVSLCARVCSRPSVTRCPHC